MEHVASSALPASQPPLSSTLYSSHSELLTGPPGCHPPKPSPLLGPSVHGCLLLLGDSVPLAGFSWSATSRGPSPALCLALLPLGWAPTALCASPTLAPIPCIVVICLLTGFPQRRQIT